MMAAHGISVLAQEMIIRGREDRFIAEIVPNVPPETRRRPPASCRHNVTRYLPNIAGAASTAASISYIKKLLLLLLLQQHQQHPQHQHQQGPHPFITPILASIL